VCIYIYAYIHMYDYICMCTIYVTGLHSRWISHVFIVVGSEVVSGIGLPTNKTLSGVSCISICCVLSSLSCLICSESRLICSESRLICGQSYLYM